MAVPRRLPRRCAPVLAALAAAAGGGLGAAALAGAGSASARGVVSNPTYRVDVIEHALTDTEVPVAPGGKDRKGDPLTFTNPIYNVADTRRIGHDEGFCMRLNVATGTWECLWTTFLPGGAITVQGPFYDTRSSTLAVTGGTGKYSDVRGSMYLQAFDHSKRYHFDFDLQNG